MPVWAKWRKLLATFGASMLSERELLVLVLDTAALHGRDVHLIAGRLLARFGSVCGIGQAHPAELAGVPGLGAAGAARLAAAFELARRVSAEEPPTRIAAPEDVVEVVNPLLVGQARERLVVVICDRAGRVIGTELMTQGSADRSLLPIREVVVAVLRRDGQKFALAHNHPSGDSTPSREDNRVGVLTSSAIGGRLRRSAALGCHRPAPGCGSAGLDAGCSTKACEKDPAPPARRSAGADRFARDAAEFATGPGRLRPVHDAGETR